MQYQWFRYFGITTAISISSVQPAWAQVVQVTGVQVDATTVGGQIILQTPGGTLSQASQFTVEKTAIAIFANAQLRLADSQSFQQSNPVAGIASVRVTELEGDRLQVEIEGSTAAPKLEVSQAEGRLVLTTLLVAATDEDDAEGEEEITVVGSRRPTPRSQTPATVEVKTEEDLQRERLLVRSVVDYLQTVPGVAVNRLGLLTGSLNVRGLTGERIGLLVDGERLPNRQFGPNFGTIDPFRIERIEVLKGPASSIYGADAFGGVVSVTTSTPRPDRPFRVRTNLFGGGFAEFTSNLEIQGPNYIIGGGFRTAGDAEDARGNLIPLGTAYEVNDLYASGRVDLGPLDRLELRLDRYRQNEVDLPGFRTPSDSPFQITEAINEFQNRDRYSLAYVNQGVPGGTNFTFRAYYQRFEDRTNTRNLLTIPGRTISRGPFLPPIVIPTIEIPGVTSSQGLTETVGFFGQATTSIGSAVLTYGYDFSRDSGSSFDRITRSNGPLTTRTFNGVFLQSSYEVVPPLTLSGGLRFDSFDSGTNTGLESEDSAVTFNVGGVYRFTNELSLRANFAQGFRPPTLTFLFGSSADGSFFAPTRGPIASNPSLKPERANNIDIGLNYTSGSLRGGVTYFRNDISDFLGFQSIAPRATASGFATLQTANKTVVIEGVEISLAYALNRQWTLEGNFSYADSEDTSGVPLQQLEVLPITALVRLRYDDGRFNGFFQSRIYGGQGTVILANNVIGEGSPASTVFDLGLGYRIASNTELNITVENLFNAQYIFPTLTYPAPGVRVLVGVRADF